MSLYTKTLASHTQINNQQIKINKQLKIKMNFTTTYLSLFAAVAASTMSGQVDARIGVGRDSRDLNSRDNRYTVYFANSCRTDVQVKIDLGQNNDK